jgi:putative ABC transport system permease protein
VFVELGRTVKLGLKSLLLQKLRTALTMLGILFGVFAVIAMLGIAEGASYEAQEQIKALGATNILISSRKPPVIDSATPTSAWSAVSYGLTYREVDRIARTMSEAVRRVVPVRQTDKEMRAGENFLAGAVWGTTPDFPAVFNLRIKEGRWLTELDERNRTNYCVLGELAARKLFPLDDPIGETVRAGSDRFEVVGVFELLGRASGSLGKSIDEGVFIPFATSRAWIGETTRKFSAGSMESERVEVSDLVLQVYDQAQIEDTARVVRAMLVDGHPRGDYEIQVPLELLQARRAQVRIFNILLGAIAGISLLVGGIGIMNVMLATVTERTREIGIRRALGAKKRHIINQFLVETSLISLVGGLLGVLIGRATPGIISSVFQMKTMLLPEHSILAFSVSVAVGVLFGIYPAWRAANMDPVEALRHE